MPNEIIFGQLLAILCGILARENTPAELLIVLNRIYTEDVSSSVLHASTWEAVSHLCLTLCAEVPINM